MKKFILISIVVALFAGVGCQKQKFKDSDVLAAYTEGQIIRGDFVEWFTVSKRLRPDTVYTSIRSQEWRLRELFFERMRVKEAGEHPFFNSPDFKMYMSFIEDEHLAGYTNARLRSDLQVDTTIYDISIIMLSLDAVSFEGNKEKAIEAQMPLVNEILEKLRKGENFDGIAMQYSVGDMPEDQARIGWVIRELVESITDKSVYEAIQELRKGRYTTKPIITDDAIYIVKLYDSKRITNKNIVNRTIVKDPMTNQRLAAFIHQNAILEVMEGITSQPDLNFPGRDSNLRNPNEILFEVGDKKYLVDDLNKLLAFVTEKLWMPVSFEETISNERHRFTIDEKKGLVNQWYHNVVMAREGRTREFDQSEEYVTALELFRNAEIDTIYRYMFVLGNYVPTNAELLAYHNEKNRELLANPQTRRYVPSFASVRDDLREEVYNNTKLNNRLSWEERVISENNFKINEEKLVPERPLKPGERPPAPTY